MTASIPCVFDGNTDPIIFNMIPNNNADAISAAHMMPIYLNPDLDSYLISLPVISVHPHEGNHPECVLEYIVDGFSLFFFYVVYCFMTNYHTVLDENHFI